MITEKSKNILRRAVAWLMIWKGYVEESPSLADTEPAENVWNMARNEIGRLDKEDWQKEECLNGRR